MGWRTLVRIYLMFLAPMGATHGVNIVNIAFADPRILEDDCEMTADCVSAGLDIKDPVRLLGAVNTIHAAGGYVKIALGGDVYGNPAEGISFQEVDKLASRIVRLVDDYNLDGVDLTTVRDCGVYECAYAENQLYLIYRLRSLLPNKIISYTFPSSPNYSPTYSLVIQSSISHLDYVSISQCSQSGRISGINELLEMGVPQHKIVCGVILYRDCYYNENNGGMGNTIAAAELVLSEQLGGVMTWSINTDTDHRGDNEIGACTDFQTGKSDGTYIDTISYILNHS